MKELLIVIDQVKKQEQIDQIVGTEFFQDLLGKAKKVRSRDTLQAEPTEPASQPAADLSSPQPL